MTLLVEPMVPPFPAGFHPSFFTPKISPSHPHRIHTEVPSVYLFVKGVGQYQLYAFEFDDVYDFAWSFDQLSQPVTWRCREIFLWVENSWSFRRRLRWMCDFFFGGITGICIDVYFFNRHIQTYTYKMTHLVEHEYRLFFFGTFNMCLPCFKTPFPQKKTNLQMTCEQCKKAPWLFRGFLGDEKRPSHVGIIRNHSKDTY